MDNRWVRIYFAIIVLQIILYAAPAISEEIANSCWKTSGSAIIRRDNVYFNVVYARGMLSAYDEIIQGYAIYGGSEGALSRLNAMRGEILNMALSAYFFCGERLYPSENEKLLKTLDSLKVSEYQNLEFPYSIDALVDCGILSHLPVSPYNSGRYVNELINVGEAGDVFYYPIAVYSNILLNEPGHYEGCLLLIFDTLYNGNEKLLTFEQMEDTFPGELAKFVPADALSNVCFIWGSDPDSW